MTAVNPTRLSMQIADLIESFDSPETFHKHIRDLFSRYANRTLRYGEKTNRATLMPTYHLPDPVMRQLRVELKPFLSQQPEVSLNLADVLWTDEAFEIRQVAVYILGHTGTPEPEPIISRLENWLSPDLEPALKEAVLFSATEHLQSRFPQRWEVWVSSLLARDDPAWIAMGLLALRSGVKSSPAQKLPVIFRVLSPFIRDPRPGIMNEMMRLIKDLAEQSPTETAYYLRQTLSLSADPATSQLIRQCLPAFPEELRKEIQAAIKAK